MRSFGYGSCEIAERRGMRTQDRESESKLSNMELILMCVSRSRYYAETDFSARCASV